MQDNLTWKLDMKDVIRKALMKQGGRNGPDSQLGAGSLSVINISHLNPLKSVKGYKSSVEVRSSSFNSLCQFKQKSVKAKLKDIEDIIIREIKLVDYEPLDILESLNEETLARVVSHVQKGAVVQTSAESVFECMALVKDPHNLKLQKYNEKLSQTILTLVQGDKKI